MELDRYKKKVSHSKAQKLPFQLYFKKTGFPMVCADWCETNCIKSYGWHFIPENIIRLEPSSSPTMNDVYVGFENQMDMFMFQIYWAEEFGGKE